MGGDLLDLSGTPQREMRARVLLVLTSARYIGRTQPGRRLPCKLADKSTEVAAKRRNGLYC